MSGIFRNETWKSGVLVRAEIFDFDAGTVTVEEDGQVVSTRPTTVEDEAQFAPLPPSWEEEVDSRLADAERPDHVQEWVAPSGAHDAPNIGDHRWFDGQVWRSLIDGNTTVPGSDDRWWEPTDPPAIPDTLRDPLRALRPQVAAASNAAQLRDATLAILDTLTGDA